MNRHRHLTVIAALAALAWAASAGADVPGHISYQGMILDGGAPYTGEANFKFALVDSVTNDYFWSNDGTLGYPAEAVRVALQEGLFSVLLGAPPMAPIDPSAVANFTRDQALRIWVEMGDHGEILLGSMPLSSVLFAHQAELARASDGDFTAQGQIWSQSGGFKFPDGTVQETAATGSGGGDCLWSAGTGGWIYYNAGNVGIGTDNPIQKLTLGDPADNANYLRFNSTNYAGLLFHDSAGLPVGRIVYEPSGNLMRFYTSQIERMRISSNGYVGIGTTSPEARLHINGTARVTGFQLGTSATAGHVLTANASGVGTWQPAPAGGDSPWLESSGGIYYDDGHVGIGTSAPSYPLHAVTDSQNRSAHFVNSRVSPEPSYGTFSSAVGAVGGAPGSMHYGVRSEASNAHMNFGVFGGASNGQANYGVYGSANSFGATSNYGVYGTAAHGTNNYAGYFDGRGYFSDNVGIGTTNPEHSLTVMTTTRDRAGSFINSNNSTYLGYGIYSAANGDVQSATGTIHYGVYATASKADWNIGLYAAASEGNLNYAGYFFGDTHVTGTLSKGAGSFKIDHPLDPANKYLSHSFVESPDMMNIYNGNVVTDGSGRATIELPDWFEVLNRDFRYQVTVIDETDSDEFVLAKIIRGVQNGSFAIRTSAPNVEVSWQVTGIRQDAYANAHRIPVEEGKPSQERGTYLHPEALGLPADLQVDRVREARIENHR